MTSLLKQVAGDKNSQGYLEPGVSRHQNGSKSEGLEGQSVRSVGSCGLWRQAWGCWGSAGPVGEEERV